MVQKNKPIWQTFERRTRMARVCAAGKTLQRGAAAVVGGDEEEPSPPPPPADLGVVGLGRRRDWPACLGCVILPEGNP